MRAALLAVALAAPRLMTPAGQTTRAEVRLQAEVAAGAVTLSVNGADAGTCEVGGKREVVAHCRAPLGRGPNQLVLADATGATPFTVTRYDTTGPLVAGVELSGFGAGAVHVPEVEAACARCHPMTEAVGLDAGASLLGSGCASCHADLLNRKSIHGPVGQGACLACHEAGSSRGRYAVRWPMQDTCFKCHADIRGAMERKAFRHGPAAAGRCTTCHDPHGSEQPFWLKKRAFDLCTGCHTEKRQDRHVVVGFVYGDSHPLQGRPHPLKPGVEFACPACHNPHAAQARFLFQFDVTDREVLCRTCHAK